MKQLINNTEMVSKTKSYFARGFIKPSYIIIAFMAIFASLHPVKSFAGGRDTTPPVLIIGGPDTTSIVVGNTWSSLVLPSIITAFDSVDGNLKGSVVIDTSHIDLNTIGVYPVIYSVSDLSGNKTVVDRYVDVIDTGGVSSGAKPVLHILGAKYYYQPLNYAYHDSGAYATSPYFTRTQLQSRIQSTSNLDINKIGTYHITYTLTDSFGNVAVPVTRTIDVMDDSLPPNINLRSSGIDQVCLNSTFNDYGYSVGDPLYNSSDITVDTLGNFKGTGTSGLYYFRYKATNPAGKVSYSSYKYVYVLPANDEVCLSGAKPNEIDTMPCKASCYTLSDQFVGSKYVWSNGDTTRTTTICTNSDTVIAVNSTNSSGVKSFVYSLTMEPSNYDCVWPGDANGDGVADNNDVLAIGIAYQDSGYYKRANATTNWTGQPSQIWGRTFSTGAYYNSADCNGDGYVDSLDLGAIYKNYGYTHHKTGSPNGSPSDPPLSVTFANDSTQTGDTVTATINLGTASNPVANAYGIAFSLSYNDLYVKSGKAKANAAVSWLGTPGKNLVYFMYDDSANATIDFAITRTDHNNISGYGELSKICIVMQDNLGGKTFVNRKVVLTPSNVNLISYNQTQIPLYATGDSFIVTGPASIPHLSNQLKDVKLYPNPASQLVYVDPGNQNITNIRIINTLGMVVYEQNEPNKGILQIPVSSLNSGIYTVIIDSKNGTVTRQMFKN